VHEYALNLISDLRGLCVDKEDGGVRPLGLGETERRLNFACMAAQKKAQWEKYFTSMPPEDVKARAEEIDAAKLNASHAAAVLASAIGAGYSDATDRAIAAQRAADLQLAEAEKMPNIPVNLAYSSSGCELLCHVVDSWIEDDSTDHCLSDDKCNMYNTTCSESAFKFLRTRDPELVPLYRLFYGRCSRIFFCPEKGPLRFAHMHEGDMTDDVMQRLKDKNALAPDARTLADERLWMACTGGHQGCPGATYFCCGTYHESLLKTQKQMPNVRIACLADDTYLSGAPEDLYPGYETLRENTKRDCGTSSKLSKVVAYTRDGSHHDIPSDVPGSARYAPAGCTAEQAAAARDGNAPRACGFKCVGTFKGDDDWCTDQLEKKLAKRMQPLDSLDRYEDDVDCETAATHRRQLHKDVAATIPAYFARAMSPAVARYPLSCASARLRRSHELLSGADASSPARRDMAWREATLSVAAGGSGLTDWSEHAGAARCASVLRGWRKLQAISPIFAAQDIANPTLPILREVELEYNLLRDERDRIDKIYKGYDATKHHTQRGGAITRFHLKSLPPASAMPDLQRMFNDTKDKIPAQRTMSNVIYNSAHLKHLETTTAIDATNGEGVTTIPHRETNRFLSISQAHSGDWCTVRTDGSRATTPRSDQTRTAMARRHGLLLKDAVEVIDELRASDDPALKKVGYEHDYLGDHLCNTDDRNGRHHEHNRAWHAAIAAVSLHTVLLGDKDKEAKSKSPLVSFNAGHVADIVEPGGGPGGCDRLFEGKVVSPCVESPYQTGDMKGTKPPKIGHLYGFGNTEESYNIMILGNKRRGPLGTPFDPDTGEGHVEHRDGHYADALKRGKKVIPLIAEVFGGLAPHAARFLRQLSRVAAKHTTRDSTKYGRSARSFSEHHGQRISHAIVMTDALNICEGTTKLKKRLLMQSRAD
jgi:hypothetical protein